MIKKTRIFLGTFIQNSEIKTDIFLESFFPENQLRAVKRENLHLTWKFIGDVDEDELEKIKIILDSTLNYPLDVKLRFDRFEIWPNLNNPRQLVLTGNDLNGNATQIYKNLNNSLAKIVKKEKRAFRPHITFARFKNIQNPVITDDLINRFKNTIVKIHNISLIESILTPQGSIYNTIQKYPICNPNF